MHEEIAPLLIMMQNGWSSQYSIKIEASRTSEALAHIASVMARWEPEFPLTYEFFDQQFDNLHQAEDRVGSLLTYFAILAIFIACLGLFGLASFRQQPAFLTTVTAIGAKGPAAPARGNSSCTSPSVQYVGDESRPTSLTAGICFHSWRRW